MFVHTHAGKKYTYSGMPNTTTIERDMKRKKLTGIASKRRVAPDEFFERGPISLSLFGNLTVGQSSWQPDQFKEFQKRLAGELPRIASEIDALIAEASGLVAATEPLSLLHRAWWERAAAYIGINSEIEIHKEHAHKQRMIDYVQSLIAATPPAARQEAASEEAWGRLSTLVAYIFEKLNPWYFISEGAQRRAADPTVNEAAEEFRFRSQIIWCNVTGAQYQVHHIQALRELLIPQSDIIRAAYGISGEQLCDELAKIWHSLTMGISDAFTAMNEFRLESLAALESDIAAGLVGSGSFTEQLNTSISRHNLDQKRDDAVGLFFGMDLFDLQKITALPQQFLEDFSWAPGEEKTFLADGDLRGWPLRIWPTFMRPFVKADGKYYCFDQTVLFDHFFRQLEKRIYQMGERTKQVWIATRKEVTESLPFEYLARILPQARQFREIYYPLSEDGKKSKLYETDGILMYDDHLFVIEVKSGAFTYTDPTSDFEAHMKSLGALLADPAKQGSRFLKYLRSADEVPLFDSNGKELVRVRHGDFRQVTVCAISLDPFTEVAAQTQRVHEIGIEIGSEPVWALSLDDLRVYADIFTNPLEFLHCVEQRKVAFASDKLELDDELDHLGLYLKHNHYSKHVEVALGGPNSRVRVLGYRQKIDEFFSARLRDASTETPLKQDMPPLMSELLKLLARSTKPGRSDIASHVLDLAGEWRKDLFDHASQEMARSDHSRPRPFSTTGEVRITLVPWTKHWGAPEKGALLDHIKAMLLLHGEADRHLLELGFDDGGRLVDADWAVVSPHIDWGAEDVATERNRVADFFFLVKPVIEIPTASDLGSGEFHEVRPFTRDHVRVLMSQCPIIFYIREHSSSVGRSNECHRHAVV